MSAARRRGLRYAALAALYLLHNDLWLWDDGSLALGLPVGLTYHVLYCLAAAALLWLLTRAARPGEPAGAGAAGPPGASSREHQRDRVRSATGA